MALTANCDDFPTRH